MQVIVTRTTNRYQRAVNGAWSRSIAEAETFEIDEESLKPRKTAGGLPLTFSINAGIRVVWPDGVAEQAYPFNGGASPGYAPVCIPGNGRLATLFFGKLED